MSVQRKSSVTKAPAATVLETISAPAPAPIIDESVGDRVALEPKVELEAEPVRPRGRPRSRRRMEPFSSKIEMGLRDELDAYLAETGETVVDFLDRAIRDRLAR